MDFGDRHRVRDGFDAEFTKKCTGDCSKRHAGRRFTSRRPLEHRSCFVEVIFLHTGKVCVTGSWSGQRSATTRLEHRGVNRRGVHDLGPLRPLSIADAERHGATNCQPVTNSTRDVYLISFELHASTATVSEATTCEVRLDFFDRNGNA
jgi:hypothetical protein